jgi:hypothetical protein
MNSPLETQRRSRPNWKTFTNECWVQHIVNKKNWIRIFVIVHALNHSSPTQYSPFRIFVLLRPTCLCRIYYCQRLL